MANEISSKLWIIIMLLLFRNFLKFNARLFSIYFVRDEPSSNFGQDSVFSQSV